MPGPRRTLTKFLIVSNGRIKSAAASEGAVWVGTGALVGIESTVASSGESVVASLPLASIVMAATAVPVGAVSVTLARGTVVGISSPRT